MKILVIDVGGTHVKVLATGQAEPRRFDSGRHLNAAEMVAGVKAATSDWQYDVVSIGYPGVVLRNRPIAEPHNLGLGWVGFDYAKALGAPVRIINDAAMQALGDYSGGHMLFLGLGTGLGTAMICDGVIEPMELGHARYRKRTYEEYVGQAGIDRMGLKRWRGHVAKVVDELAAALEPTDIVIGGGNVRLLDALPPGCRAGDNSRAFIGGFRLWDDGATVGSTPREHTKGGAKPAQRSETATTASAKRTQRSSAKKKSGAKPAPAPRPRSKTRGGASRRRDGR